MSLGFCCLWTWAFLAHQQIPRRLDRSGSSCCIYILSHHEARDAYLLPALQGAAGCWRKNNWISFILLLRVSMFSKWIKECFVTKFWWGHIEKLGLIHGILHSHRCSFFLFPFFFYPYWGPECSHNRRLQIWWCSGQLACPKPLYCIYHGSMTKFNLISSLQRSSALLMNKSCQLVQQFVMKDVFFHFTSRPSSCISCGCQHLVITAVVKIQTSAHSGHILNL